MSDINLTEAVASTLEGINRLIVNPMEHSGLEGEIPEDHPVAELLEEIHELTDHLYWKHQQLTDTLKITEAKAKMERLTALNNGGANG